MHETVSLLARVFQIKKKETELCLTTAFLITDTTCFSAARPRENHLSVGELRNHDTSHDFSPSVFPNNHWVLFDLSSLATPCEANEFQSAVRECRPSTTLNGLCLSPPSSWLLACNGIFAGVPITLSYPKSSSASSGSGSAYTIL